MICAMLWIGIAFAGVDSRFLTLWGWLPAIAEQWFNYAGGIEFIATLSAPSEKEENMICNKKIKFPKIFLTLFLAGYLICAFASIAFCLGYDSSLGCAGTGRRAKP